MTLFFIGTAGEVEIGDVGSLGAFLVSTAAQGVTGDIHSMGKPPHPRVRSPACMHMHRILPRTRSHRSDGFTTGTVRDPYLLLRVQVKADSVRNTAGLVRALGSVWSRGAL